MNTSPQNQLTSVTPLSKFLAMALFVILPFVGLYIGYTFAPERVVAEKVVERVVELEKAMEERDLTSDYFSSEEYETCGGKLVQVEMTKCFSEMKLALHDVLRGLAEEAVSKRTQWLEDDTEFSAVQPPQSKAVENIDVYIVWVSEFCLDTSKFWGGTLHATEILTCELRFLETAYRSLSAPTKG